MIIAMFTVGNGFALSLLFPLNLYAPDADSLEGQWDSMKLVNTTSGTMQRSFEIMMGQLNLELLNQAYSPVLAWLVFFVYVMVVNIVMLNLLIAL